MIFDKNHNEVKIGHGLKVLSIDPGFIFDISSLMKQKYEGHDQ